MSPDESSFVLAAENAITDLKKAAGRRTAWNVVLSIVSVVTVLAVALGVLLFFQLHQQAVSSCETGNDRAAGTVTALNQLVTILEGPNPTAEIRQEATQYEAFVAQHNSPRNCQQAYTVFP